MSRGYGKNSATHKLIEYIITHPNRCKRTCATVICREIEQQDDAASLMNLQQSMTMLIKSGLVHVDSGGLHDNDYTLNYDHKLFPKDLLEKYAGVIRSIRAERESELEPGQYLDDEGAIVTPAKQVAKEVEPIVEEEPVTQEIAIPVKVEKDGKQLNITINVNLSL